MDRSIVFLCGLATIAALAACAGPELEVNDTPAPAQLTDIPGDEGRAVFSADGSRIVFSARGEGGGTDLAVLDLATGSLTWVTSTPDAAESAYGWTPGGDAVVYAARDESGTRIVRTTLSDLTTDIIVTAEAAPSRLRFSPGFEELVYVTSGESGTGIWTAPTDGGEAQERISLSADFRPAGFSPDRSALIGSVRSGPSQDIFSLDLSDGRLTQLTRHPHEEWSVRPPPTGDWIAFYSTYDDAMTDIRIVNRLTGDEKRLTTSESEDFGPYWSPDGTRLAFMSDREAKNGLWIVDAESMEEKPVLPDTRLDGFPIWSPNGTHIAYQYVEAKERLYRVHSSGGSVRPFGPDTLEASSPFVSPDGSRIAFHTVDLGSEGDVVLLDIATGALTPLTSTYENVKEESWSPDGSQLSVRRNAGGWYRTAQVYSLDLASGEETQLTTSGWMRTTLWCGDYVYYRRSARQDGTGALTLWRVPSGGGDETRLLDFAAYPRDCRADGAVLYSTAGPDGSELRWVKLGTAGQVLADELALKGASTGRASSDGRIAYVGEQAGQPDLFVFDPATGTRTRLTDTPWEESAPDWSPDGEWIYFSARPADTDLWWVEVGKE